MMSNARSILEWRETTVSEPDLVSSRGSMTGSQSVSSGECVAMTCINASMNTPSTLRWGSLNSRVNTSVSFFTSVRLSFSNTQWTVNARHTFTQESQQITCSHRQTISFQTTIWDLEWFLEDFIHSTALPHFITIISTGVVNVILWLGQLLKMMSGVQCHQQLAKTAMHSLHTCCNKKSKVCRV